MEAGGTTEYGSLTYYIVRLVNGQQHLIPDLRPTLGGAATRRSRQTAIDLYPRLISERQTRATASAQAVRRPIKSLMRGWSAQPSTDRDRERRDIPGQRCYNSLQSRQILPLKDI
jgi:hypothetical protein